jgi:hypothetical protein
MQSSRLASNIMRQRVRLCAFFLSLLAGVTPALAADATNAAARQEDVFRLDCGRTGRVVPVAVGYGSRVDIPTTVGDGLGTDTGWGAISFSRRPASRRFILFLSQES